jgi:hypothetical protein
VSVFETNAFEPMRECNSESARHLACHSSLVIDVYSQGNTDFQSEDWSLRFARLRPIPELASQLESLGLKVDLRLTSGPGDATEIAARAARNGSSDVIVAGGDGTINEAIQGLAGTNARLAIIPRGTANVLARELGLPLDDEQALQIAAQGKSRKIYLGLAIDETTNESRHFVLMAGIGLDASVVRRVQPSLKKRIGKGAFWISGLSHLATWNPKPFTLESTAIKNTPPRLQRSEKQALWRRSRDHAGRAPGPTRV